MVRLGAVLRMKVHLPTLTRLNKTARIELRNLLLPKCREFLELKKPSLPSLKNKAIKNIDS